MDSEEKEKESALRTRAESLITKLSSVSDETRSSALCRLRLLTKSTPSIRAYITTIDDGAALSYLSESLYSTSSVTQDNAAATLLNLSISCPDTLMATPGLLHAISHSLSQHSNNYSPSAVQSAAATLYSLSLHPDHRATIGSMRDILYTLLDIVSIPNSPSRSVKDSVKALFGLSLHPPNRDTMLSLDAAGVLFGRIVRDGRVGMLEDVTAVVAQLAGSHAAPVSFRTVGGVRVLVDLVGLDATLRVRENAVGALLRLVEFGGEAVADEIREVGLGVIFDGLGEVVHCGSDKAKIRAQALMDVLESGISSKMSSFNFSQYGTHFASGPLSDSSRSSY
ncbi:uncharacterized protein LOC141657424 [Silene latifolia]|uniref:uncharacterized protein LOC141657424 n=1 Tax=Silene latifolia TaxID=37657 RepID=UPI003D76E6D3